MNNNTKQEYAINYHEQRKKKLLNVVIIDTNCLTYTECMAPKYFNS